MSAISFLVIIAMLVAMGLTLAGNISMAKTGPCDGTRSTSFMGARIIAQAIAVSMIIIAVLFWN